MNKETYERAKLQITEFHNAIHTDADALTTSGFGYDPTIGINGSFFLGATWTPPFNLQGNRD